MLNAKITNKTLTDANTEYSVELSLSARVVIFQCRTAADVRFAFATGVVAASSPYFTMKSGAVVDLDFEEGESPTPLTLYLASGSAGVVVEILELY